MKKLFTSDEMMVLSNNKYTANVTESQIKFADDFKDDFLRLYLIGMSVKNIFITLGYDPDLFGTKRTDVFVYNLRKHFLTNEQKYNSQSRTSITKRPPTEVDYSQMHSSDAIRAMQTELQYLRQEVVFFKTLCFRSIQTGGQFMITKEEKFQLIDNILNQPNNLIQLDDLCEIACVSRSGYYY